MFKLLKRLEEIVGNNELKIAYQVNDESITYGELWKRASVLATSLKSEGISPVIIYGHKSANMIVSILACLMANRTYIPIDLHVPKERIEEIVQMCNATLLICNEDIFLANVKFMNVSEINEVYSNQKIQDTSKNQIAYIIFTSGSSGKPKGVPISYDNLENFIQWILTVLPNDSKLNVLNQASFSFDLSVTDLYYSLFTGNKLVALTKETQKDYSQIFKVIENYKINIVVLTPTFVKLLLFDTSFCEQNYPNIQWFYFCGEQLEVLTVKKIKERFPNATIINAYGPTEATSAVSAIEMKEEMLNGEYLPVGVVKKAAVKIEIVNDEIVLKGKSVFDGYLNIISDNCYREMGICCYKTGDIGKIENGLLYCLGRKDTQIKLSGYRIELGDIENNLLKMVEIQDAVVIPKYKKNSKMVKYLKAFVTLKKEISIGEIKEKLLQVLPSYMIPKFIEILEKMPMNENGKCDRKKLSTL